MEIPIFSISRHSQSSALPKYLRESQWAHGSLALNPNGPIPQDSTKPVSAAPKPRQFSRAEEPKPILQYLTEPAPEAPGHWPIPSVLRSEAPGHDYGSARPRATEPTDTDRTNPKAYGPRVLRRSVRTEAHSLWLALRPGTA